MSQNALGQRILLTRLFDLYSPLLSAGQRQVFALHEEEDWSLSEIADHLSMTRQGASAQLMKARERLEELESQLKFSGFLEQLAHRLTRIGGQVEDQGVKEQIEQLILLVEKGDVHV